MSNSDIVLPEDLPEARRKWKTRQDEVDYWTAHPKTRLPSEIWGQYYCVSTQHRGLHCGSCLSDEEYTGQPNFDDMCCCKAEPPTNPNQYKGEQDNE